MVKVAIIGAGLSGLTIGQLLQNKCDITIFEKSRGVGGRIATRRHEPFDFDHGAQFFTVHNEEFQTFIQPLLESRVIKRWDARFVEIDVDQILSQRPWNESYPHYVGVPHMNAIAKHLQKNLHIVLNTRIASLHQQQEQWQLIDEEKQEYGLFDWVITTAPAAQSASILPTNFSGYSHLQSVTMKSCFSLMMGFSEPLNLGFDAALIKGRDISWISVNSSKPKRDQPFSLLIHSTNRWADENFEQNRYDVMNYLQAQTELVLNQNLNHTIVKDIHGWRYANMNKKQGQSHLIDTEKKLAACGDWCIQGRIEAAFMSAYHLSKKLIQYL